MRIRMLLVVVVASGAVLLASASASVAGSVIVGSTRMAAAGGTPDLFGQNIPVFQGSASSGYVTSSPVTGTLVSWSFRSAGVTTGDRFVLRILRPVDAAQTSWRTAGTSAPQAVTSPTGTDALLGPFKTSIAVLQGDRIALQPIDEGYTPIETGVNGTDGVRYFVSPLGEGSSGQLAPGSAMNNGQVVPIQATVEPAVGSTTTTSTTTTTAKTITTATTTTTTSTSSTTTTAHLANTSLPQITGTQQAGERLTCNPGTWTGGPSFAYQWFWTGQAVPEARTPSLDARVFGVAPKALATYFRNADQLGLRRLNVLSTAQSIVVPDLGVRTGFVCRVTATAASQAMDASSAQVTITPDPPSLAKDLRLKLHPPSVDPRVGVGGSNVCTPGFWRGQPTFKYAWYQLLPASAKTINPPRKLLAASPIYSPSPDEEGKVVQCEVTATNDGGSHTETSNAYTVPLGSPTPVSPPTVAVQTPSSNGTVGPEGGEVIASQISLTCRPGVWSRSDLTFADQWIRVADDGSPVGSPALPGDSLSLDMKPGKLQYDMSVRCQVVATTSKGVSSITESGVVHVSSGCFEVYTVDGGKPHILHPMLSATVDSSAQDPYRLSAPVGGLFQLFGIPLPIVTSPVGAFKPEIYEPRRAETWGPNCLDYQHYLLGWGFDVKQGPMSDPNWIYG